MTATKPNPWDLVAAKVLAGDYATADRSTTESILIGLRSTGTWICQQAIEILTTKNGQPKWTA